MLHHIFCLSQNGELCRTRLHNPQRVLDIGTGTGIWAIEGKIPLAHVPFFVRVNMSDLRSRGRISVGRSDWHRLVANSAWLVRDLAVPLDEPY